MTHFRTGTEANDLLEEIHDRIIAFGLQCEEGDYTDTGEAWDLFDWIKKAIGGEEEEEEEGGDTNG